MTIGTILVICALLCFILAAVGVSAPVNLTALGLAFVAGAVLLGAKVFAKVT